jgi:hypothetical protein
LPRAVHAVLFDLELGPPLPVFRLFCFGQSSICACLHTGSQRVDVGRIPISTVIMPCGRPFLIMRFLFSSCISSSHHASPLPIMCLLFIMSPLHHVPSSSCLLFIMSLFFLLIFAPTLPALLRYTVSLSRRPSHFLCDAAGISSQWAHLTCVPCRRIQPA